MAGSILRALLLVGIAFAASTIDDDFSGPELAAYLKKNPEINTVPKFVASLHPSHRENYILMLGSESEQPASCTRPRIIMMGRDSSSLYAVNTEKEKGEYRTPFVEIAKNIPTKSRFEFHKVDLDGKKANVTANDKSCTKCHGKDPRPNWDAYDSWAFQLPFNRDRLYEGSEEEKAYKNMLVEMAEDPIFKQLKLPNGVKLVKDENAKGKNKYRVEIDYSGGSEEKTQDVEVTLSDGKTKTKLKQGGRYLVFGSPDNKGDEGQGINLFDRLTRSNAERVGRMVKEHPSFDKVKYALLAAIDGCIRDEKSLLEYVPKEALDKLSKWHGGKSMKGVVDDTIKRQTMLPKIKFDLMMKHLRKIIRCNAEAEGKKYSEQEIEIKARQEIAYREVDKSPKGENVTKDGIVDRETYDYNETKRSSDTRLLGLFRLLLEPEGVDVDLWSMSVRSSSIGAREVSEAQLRRRRSETYTFGDLFGSYRRSIDRVVRKGLGLLYCEDLKAKSLAAYGSKGAEAHKKTESKTEILPQPTTHK